MQLINMQNNNLYDNNKESPSLKYCNVNNGWAMSQKLLVNNFE